MGRPRLPQAVALMTGADLVHPGRFAGRKTAKRVRPVGEPYLKMTDAQKEAWLEYREELPWINSSHRPLLRLACIWTARMDEVEFGVSATQALTSILSKLGATPVDETKVNHGDGDDSEPEDKFFAGRQN